MRIATRLRATPATTWLIGHVVSPLQRWLLRVTGGRISLTGRAPVLLLTTIGRRTGKERTIPLFYVRDGARCIVCNVRPPSERPNPWPMNLRANPRGRIRVGREIHQVEAREASPDEVDRYWARLVEIWPAYEIFFGETRERSMFVLSPY